MFISLTNEGGEGVDIVATEIGALVEVKRTKPTIFIGCFIGMKNGQSFVVKEKRDLVRQKITEAVGSTKVFNDGH